MIFQYSSEPFRFDVLAHSNNRVRMFFYINDTLTCCRTEKVKNIILFFNDETATVLFKGRLKLEKVGKRLIVYGGKPAFLMLDSSAFINAIKEHNSNIQ